MQILASLKDINANLPSLDDNPAGPVIEATDENTALIQVSVARVVRGYLSRAVDNATLMAWDEPDHTPEIIREVAAKLIAAQLYFNRAARTNLVIDQRNFAQIKYDEAMKVLNGILDGSVVLEGFIVEAVDSLSELDFHPVDDTDRAFTVGMEL